MVLRLVSLLFLIFFTVREVRGQSGLQEMESIVAAHASLQEFLKNPQAVEAYYLAAKKYFGEDRFPRMAYDAILGQLRKIEKDVPGLYPRLWEGHGTGSAFSMENTLRSYGRGINETAWTERLDELTERVTEQRGSLGLLSPSALDEERVRKLQEVRQLERLDVSSLPAARRRQALGEHFGKLRQAAPVKELAATYAFEILSSERVKDLLRSGDPDLVIDTLRQLKEKPLSFLTTAPDVPSSVLSEVRALLPETKELFAAEVFPVRTMQLRNGQVVPIGSGGVTRHDFVPLPRRFHGIWKGIPLKECVAGNCGSLGWLTPSRWATVAVENSQLQFVEKNGKYSGFIEAVPGTLEGKTYATVGIGAPDLRKRFSGAGTKDHPIQKTLFEAWYEETLKRRPASWQGFVMSGSLDIDNAGVKSTVFKTPAYIFGTKIKSTEARFELLDPLGKALADWGPEGPYSNPDMVLESTTRWARATGLSILSEVPAEVALGEAHLEKLLRDPEQRASVVTLLAAQDDHDLLRKLKPVLREVYVPGSAKITYAEISHLLKTGTLEMSDEMFRWMFEENTPLEKSVLKFFQTAQGREALARLSSSFQRELSTLDPKRTQRMDFALQMGLVKELTPEGIESILRTGDRNLAESLWRRLAEIKKPELNALALQRMLDLNLNDLMPSFLYHSPPLPLPTGKLPGLLSSFSATRFSLDFEAAYAVDFTKPSELSAFLRKPAPLFGSGGVDVLISRAQHSPNPARLNYEILKALSEIDDQKASAIFHRSPPVSLPLDEVEGIHRLFPIEAAAESEHPVFKYLKAVDPKLEHRESRAWLRVLVRSGELGRLSTEKLIPPEDLRLIAESLDAPGLLLTEEIARQPESWKNLGIPADVGDQMYKWLKTNPSEINSHWLGQARLVVDEAQLLQLRPLLLRELQTVANMDDFVRMMEPYNTLAGASEARKVAERELPRLLQPPVALKDLKAMNRLSKMPLRLSPNSFPQALRELYLSPEKLVRSQISSARFELWAPKSNPPSHVGSLVTEMLVEKNFEGIFKLTHNYFKPDDVAKSVALVLESVDIKDPDFERALDRSLQSPDKKERSIAEAVNLSKGRALKDCLQESLSRLLIPAK